MAKNAAGRGGTAPRHTAPTIRALALALAVSACAGGADGREARTGGAPSTRPVPAGVALLLDFEGGYLAPGAMVATVPNAGRSRLESSVSTSAGGRITQDHGLDSGFAVRFPAFAQGPTPAAVLVLRVSGTADRLSPDDRPFSFGADFNLDARSSGSATDNGDNLLQRGLATDRSQYKVQIDRGVMSCRIAGSAGKAVLKAKSPVEPTAWYRVRCTRRGDLLTLVVRRLDGSGGRETVRVEADVGSVRFARAVPVSVGGKVAADGEVVASATDQLNGLVDNVRFELLG